jgi:hypothetical protein
VANVRLLTNGVPAATNTVAPFGITLGNLAAGTYTLLARADDQGLPPRPRLSRIADRLTPLVQPGSGGRPISLFRDCPPHRGALRADGFSPVDQSWQRRRSSIPKPTTAWRTLTASACDR